MTLVLNDVSESELSIADGETPILTYHYGQTLYKPYFHPVHAPGGQVVTEDAPEDHVHHRGLCFAWGDVNGVNYWAETNCEAAVRGRIQHREFREKTVNADRVSLVVVNDWIAPDGTKPVEETAYITVYQPQPEGQAIDFEFQLRAQSTDVVMGTPPAYHGLCYRAVDLEYRKVINSESRIGESEVKGASAKWCTLNGILADEAVGIAIFDHPSNLRHPTRFFATDGAFGFISTSFAYDVPYTIPAGDTLRLKYRVYLYRGDLFTVDLWACYEAYTNKEREQ
jgi:hypothetical protein